MKLISVLLNIVLLQNSMDQSVFMRKLAPKQCAFIPICYIIFNIAHGYKGSTPHYTATFLPCYCTCACLAHKLEKSGYRTSKVYRCSQAKGLCVKETEDLNMEKLQTETATLNSRDRRNTNS